MAKRFWNFILNASEWTTSIPKPSGLLFLKRPYGHKEVRP